MMTKLDTTQSTSFHSSVASSLGDKTDDGVNKKINIKEWLKSRIFLGRYTERRLVNADIGYRDVVLISPAETEFKRDLIEAVHQLKLLYTVKWIGVTDSEALGYRPHGICVWTEIENQPFGVFWFQIKTVKIRDNEVIIAVKCLRHITDAFLEVEPILTGQKKVNEANSSNNGVDNTSIKETYTEIVETLQMSLSIRNLKELVTFIFAFVIAIFSGSTAFINFLGNFVLALIRELSILVKNTTPMFLGVLDFLSKIVGGFYILLAMFFKPSPQVAIKNRSIQYGRHQRAHSSHYIDEQNEYDPRNFD
ncbi:uncharacterized protein LOC128671925 [Plodia interpunctella]|uniref:uncharacterized protein LOC128671925 n=1 Tax=Plodia interpunctella TaxID=58824 RepID=UPI0023679C0C|nr:uncharacterized protein LOC128671925 [Plodia interpunctella]